MHGCLLLQHTLFYLYEHALQTQTTYSINIHKNTIQYVQTYINNYIKDIQVLYPLPQTPPPTPTHPNPHIMPLCTLTYKIHNK